MSERLKQWMVEHAMGTMFQLNELKKDTGLDYTVGYNMVTFHGYSSQHPLAQELNGKSFTLDTWDEVLPSNLAIQRTRNKPRKYTDDTAYSG